MSSDNIYWSFIFKFLNRGSDEYLPEILFAERTGLQYMNLVITTNTQVPEQRLAQRFRDGPVHCIIDPLVSLWKKMGENSDSDSSRKRCFQVMRKIEGLRSRFAAGVPEGSRVARRQEVAQPHLVRVAPELAVPAEDRAPMVGGRRAERQRPRRPAA
jgi:hypothetical protein